MITLAGKGKLVSVDSGEVAADFAATPRLSTGPARHEYAVHHSFSCCHMLMLRFITVPERLALGAC